RPCPVRREKGHRRGLFAPGAYSAGKPRIAGRASEAAGGERPADRRTPAGERRLFPAKFVTDAVRLAGFCWWPGKEISRF
ncbi:hypothetical protein, partial [Anaerotruncus colihominis]|uniref:hypothetical protein n=1 Tax=Anaerotruncus colihominis TaxID=169435 RepID=UPI001A9AC51D